MGPKRRRKHFKIGMKNSFRDATRNDDVNKCVGWGQEVGWGEILKAAITIKAHTIILKKYYWFSILSLTLFFFAF